MFGGGLAASLPGAREFLPMEIAPGFLSRALNLASRLPSPIHTIARSNLSTPKDTALSLASHGPDRTCRAFIAVVPLFTTLALDCSICRVQISQAQERVRWQ